MISASQFATIPLPIEAQYPPKKALTMTQDRNPEIEILLDREKQQVEEFIRLFSVKGVDYEIISDKEENWTAKEILAHIVFWHESFARNISDMGEKREPKPLRGSMTEAIYGGIRENRSFPISTLLRRLRKAQKLIEKYIYDSSIHLIPYKQGSRPYSRAEHLDVVAHHINTYYWRVVRSYLEKATSESDKK
ncbi:hypothetical protein HC823_00240 [Candidatus Gracilibacteria bacterium]|nr:hypothetical protein [Candidatus Gracilibacteria bacterium]